MWTQYWQKLNFLQASSFKILSLQGRVVLCLYISSFRNTFFCWLLFTVGMFPNINAISSVAQIMHILQKNLHLNSIICIIKTYIPPLLYLTGVYAWFKLLNHHLKNGFFRFTADHVPKLTKCSRLLNVVFLVPVSNELRPYWIIRHLTIYVQCQISVPIQASSMPYK